MLAMGASTADYDLYIYSSAGTALGGMNGAGSIDSASSANATAATSARYVRLWRQRGDEWQIHLKLAW